MTHQPISVQVGTNGMLITETWTYPAASDYPSVMAHIVNMQQIAATRTYQYITGCGLRTAIFAVKRASRNIPGYCDECGNKSHKPPICDNWDHAADIAEYGSCDVCGMFADQMRKTHNQCKPL